MYFELSHIHTDMQKVPTVVLESLRSTVCYTV
jgi:hypothetical protein